MGRSGARYAPSQTGLLLPSAASKYSQPPGNSAALALTQDTEYAIGIAFSNIAGPITAVGVNVTTAAASTVVRFGIRADAGNAYPYPGTLLNDLGTVATTGTGWKEVTGLSITLEAMRQYWFTVTLQTNTGVSVSGLNGQTTPVIGSANPAALVYGGYSQTGVTGALGAAFSSTIATVTVPRIGIKF
jgi:hypothetical protein